MMQIHKSFILNMTYFRGLLSREVELVGLKAIKLPTGLRKNFPDFFNYLETDNFPNKE